MKTITEGVVAFAITLILTCAFFNPLAGKKVPANGVTFTLYSGSVTNENGIFSVVMDKNWSSTKGCYTRTMSIYRPGYPELVSTMAFDTTGDGQWDRIDLYASHKGKWCRCTSLVAADHGWQVTRCKMHQHHLGQNPERVALQIGAIGHRLESDSASIQLQYGWNRSGNKLLTLVAR